MELIDSKFLVKNLVIHSYDTNPDYNAKISFLYFSPDEKVISFYWEAPRGYFDYRCNGYDEVLYTIEGRMELISEAHTIIVKKGEIYRADDGDIIRFNILDPVKSFGFVYPATVEALEGIKRMIEAGRSNH